MIHGKRSHGQQSVYRRLRTTEAQIQALRTALIEVHTRVGENLPAELVPASAGAANGKWPEYVVHPNDSYESPQTKE